MKAFVYDKKASGEKLRAREIDAPIPKAGEVLIEIHAVSVNAADYRSMQMGIIPKGAVFGADIAGRVAVVGPGVRSLQVGDDVVCDSSGLNFGGFAEFAALGEAALTRMPAGLSYETCAAVPLASVTALQGLRKSGVDLRGKSVLINGAAGGVGSYAVQLAKHLGAEVTGVCGPENVGRVKALGADRVFDYTKESLESHPTRYDVALGVHGNCGLRTYRKLLNPLGRYVMIGGSFRQIFGALILGPLYSFGGKKMLALAAKPSPEDLRFVLSLVANGKVKPPVEKVYAFEQIPEAVARAAGGHAWGKLVIKVRA